MEWRVEFRFWIFDFRFLIAVPVRALRAPRIGLVGSRTGVMECWSVGVMGRQKRRERRSVGRTRIGDAGRWKMRIAARPAVTHGLARFVVGSTRDRNVV